MAVNSGDLVPNPTIGTVEWNGLVYEIDWPFLLDDENERDPYLAAVYRDGRQLAELNHPWFGEPFTSKAEVMHLAADFIRNGGLVDD